MKVAVVGSRTFRDWERLRADLDRCRACWGDFTVVSGGAQGADTLAVVWAKRNHLPVEVFKADWDRHGKAAGPLRNTQIVEAADAVVAFHDGQSRGTADTIQQAEAAGKRVYVRLF